MSNLVHFISEYKFEILVSIGIVFLCLFVRFVVKDSRYIYISGVIEKPHDKPKLIENKHEAAIYNGTSLVNYLEVKIDRKGKKHRVCKDGRWSDLRLNEEEAQEIIKQAEQGVEHPILIL